RRGAGSRQCLLRASSAPVCVSSRTRRPALSGRDTQPQYHFLPEAGIGRLRYLVKCAKSELSGFRVARQGEIIAAERPPSLAPIETSPASARRDADHGLTGSRRPDRAKGNPDLRQWVNVDPARENSGKRRRRRVYVTVAYPPRSRGEYGG